MSQINKLYIIIFFSVLLSVNYSAKAQEVEVSAKLDTTEFLIGDQVGLELKVKQPVREFVGIPSFDQDVNQELEVLEQSENDTTLLESGHYIIKKRLLVTVFDSGYYALPPIGFLYYTDTLKTDPIAFKVNSMPVDTTQAIKDIKMPYGAPISFAEVYPWVGGGLGLILLILLIWYVVRKVIRKEPLIRKIKPLEPAHIIALRDLDKLKNQKLWQKDQVKEYYTELSDILRLYLWNRYAIRTLERTSEEILVSLKISGFNDEKAYEALKEIFTTSDLVKFAKFKPLADEHEKCMTGAYSFVDNTKLIIEEKSQEDSEDQNKESIDTESSKSEKETVLDEHKNS